LGEIREPAPHPPIVRIAPRPVLARSLQHKSFRPTIRALDLSPPTHKENEMTILTALKLPASPDPDASNPLSAFPSPATSRASNPWPIDWPAPGPIDLSIQDLPHASASTEWWYLNAHVETADGRQLSLFAAFFRIIRAQDPVTKALEYAHSLTWAISDPAAKVYSASSHVDKHAARMGIERIRNGRGSKDPRLNRAMLEVLETGEIPLPDRRFSSEVAVAHDRLALDFGGALLSKDADGQYELTLRDDARDIGCKLSFRPRKAPTRHGEDGLVQGTSGETMFYYFVPRCDVQGTVTTPGLPDSAVLGSGWYDHEFGVPPEPQAVVASAPPQPEDGATPQGAVPPPADEMAWTWMAAQLDDGRELTAYRMIRAATQEVVGQRAILIAPDGTTQALSNLNLEVVAGWRSIRSFQTYPTALKLEIPDLDLDLTIQATFPDQEFLTVISKPAFWEGRCTLSGHIAGQPVQGTAYLERSGYEVVETLDQFFGEVGAEVRASVAAVLPLEPTPAEALELIGNPDRPQSIEGVDIPQLARTLFQPIRTISDRGGKSWRSYAALACCDVVQGDSRRFARWLAMPELMHVGSLIVDDVQDKSTVRRGGPTCHLMYGEPLAINAGTAAYFLLHQLLMSTELAADKKLKIYGLYFEALRAGHAGQALDLDGLDDLMPSVVESGDNQVLEARVRACHRLKTGAPAGALARMGAVAGDGSDAQVEALGNYFESLGLAFQILDDVLNLRGFKGDLKSRGEDIVNGTITLPIAKAMGRLDRAQRQWLWDLLQSSDHDGLVVLRALRLLEKCGAVQACVDDAEILVEKAWKDAEPLFKPSLTKVMLRAFSWYVLERHY
jgi:geranylgeranyl pyrophosphate synthase/predicted secreted hydrolase